MSQVNRLVLDIAAQDAEVVAVVEEVCLRLTGDCISDVLFMWRPKKRLLDSGAASMGIPAEGKTMVKVYDKQGGSQTFNEAEAVTIGGDGVLLVLRVAASATVTNVIAAYAGDAWRWATTIEPQAGPAQGTTHTV